MSLVSKGLSLTHKQMLLMGYKQFVFITCICMYVCTCNYVHMFIRSAMYVHMFICLAMYVHIRIAEEYSC